TLKSNFISFQDNWKLDVKPDPAENRNYGRWSQYAEDILLKRRHLSLIANITKAQIKRLESAGINTIDDIVNSSIEK